ncbi:DUF995 domain-containing protein [Paraburkholderia fungorum]|uniref:hypothetical protein n=1 Tax=Paraburkholderia fungorum TaxID=134537 RepID=UPI0038B96DFE
MQIQRVDFVLDAAPPTKSDEAQKKRKAEQRRAQAAKPKPGAKAASEPGALPGTPPAAAANQTSEAAPPGPAPGLPPAAAVNPTSEATPKATAQPGGQASRAAAYGPTPASSADVVASSSAAQKPVAAANPQPTGAGRPPRVTKEQLQALLPGSTMLRTNIAGALRQWVNKPDGTLTVYWGGAGLRQSHSASGRWSVTDEGRFCLHIDWEDLPENWCRFLEQTANGEYQPIADIADANWTPPPDKTNWRPLTIRH